MNRILIKLGEVAEFTNGGAWSEKEYVDSGIPVARISDFVDGSIDLSQCKYLPESSLKMYEKHRLSEGDLVIAMVGSHPVHPASVVGRPVIVPRRASGALLNQNAVCITPNSPRLNKKYLGLLARSKFFRDYIIAHARGAANQVRMGIGLLKEMPIDLPPLQAQRQIAMVLSAYDDLIQNNTRRIEILEEMAQRIYEEWFVYFRFPGHEKMKMVESSLGMIPRGWEARALKEICERVDYGYTASAKNEKIGPKFLRITDIVPSVINWPRVPFCEIDNINLRKYLLAPGDIVIARTGATTGYAKRINKLHPEAVFASYLVRLRVQNHFSNLLVGIIVESDEYKQFIKANLGGAAQPQANAQVLTSRLIVVPPQQLQQAFDKIVEPLIDQKEVLALKNDNLRSTQDLLLPKLISGEIDISHFPIPTPATV